MNQPMPGNLSVRKPRQFLLIVVGLALGMYWISTAPDPESFMALWAVFVVIDGYGEAYKKQRNEK